jgi:8-oxo-dGTP diphosphatase
VTEIEAKFAGDDPRQFPHLAVTVDLVLMSIVDGVPAALLMRRGAGEGGDLWALPGGFVQIDEPLDSTAIRIMRDEARMTGAYIEQLFTFGAVERDPRMRVITVAYFGLLPAVQFAKALQAGSDLVLAEIDVPWSGETGGAVTALADEGPLSLAFDHADILAIAILRLRGKLDYSPVGFALLPELFTLRQLQDVHEAILGVKLNKPAFRRRMLDRGWLEATGTRETGSSYRPAELFRHKI